MSQPNIPTLSTKNNEDALAQSLDHLQQVLAADGAGRERQWAETVGAALDRLAVALRQHRAAARRPDGPLAEVDETRPTLARQADELRSDYDDIHRQLSDLREQVRHTTDAFAPSSGRTTSGGLDENAIRQQAEMILAGLREDREAEMKLVLDSVNTDIGAGD